MNLKTYEFIVRPMPAPRMNKSDIWRKRPVVLRYREFKDALKLQARLMKFPDPFPHRIESITYLFPPPPGFSAKKKEALIGTPHQFKPDKDNLEKAFIDSLCDKDEVVYYTGPQAKYWDREAKIVIVLDLDNMYYGDIQDAKKKRLKGAQVWEDASQEKRKAV